MLSKLEWKLQPSLSEAVLLVPYLGIFLLLSGTGPTSDVYFDFRELWLRATMPSNVTVSFSSSQDFADPAAYPSKSVCVLSLALVCRLLTLNLYHPLACGNCQAAALLALQNEFAESQDNK